MGVRFIFEHDLLRGGLKTLEGKDGFDLLEFVLGLGFPVNNFKANSESFFLLIEDTLDWF